jgi:hypothetical protein
VSGSAPLVVVRLNGGLGNQMFQFAAARTFARRTGATLKLDTSSFARDPLRTYELGVYALADTVAQTTPAERAACEQKRPRGLTRVGQSLGMMSAAAIPGLREAHFHYDPALATATAPAYLIGYWQSERYFATDADQIRHDLTPRAALEPDNAAIAAQIAGDNAVSLHVRRGDYVSDAKTQAVHGVCDLDYYARAMAAIEAQVAAPHYIVFSDDPDWTEANLTSSQPMTFVTSNPPARGYRDLQLMSLCRHHIIANSSFSWWGAWLNPRADKIVVAPDRWFATTDKNTRDLVPAGWLRV